MRRGVWAALLAAVCGSLCLIGGPPAVEFYVAPGGDDTAPGTRDRPFATLERARDAVREAAAQGRGPGGATVILRGGDHFRSGVFALEAPDSGRQGEPVVYRSQAGETARLIGGRRVRGFAPVTDPLALRRLSARARRPVLAASLRDQGIRDYGVLEPRGYGRPRRPAALEVFFREAPMTVARWPDRGFVTIDAVPGANGLPNASPDVFGAPAAGFFYEGGRPSRWRPAADIWIHGYWGYDWADSHERVASLDPRSGHVRIADPDIPFGFRPGQRFYFENVFEELDSPGEWYLDRQAGVLYFWPPTALGEGDVLVSTVSEPLVVVNRAADIELRGLVLEFGRSDAVRLVNSVRASVVDCTIRGPGQSGVIFEAGSGGGVRGCDIAQTGEAAVWLLAGDRGWLVPAGLEAVGNNIHGFGRWCRAYQPAVMIDGVGNRVAGNRLSYGPHVAVQLAGNDHVIEYNEIDHVCTETGDAGAFYMGRDWTYRGNIVRYNSFHDIQGVNAGAQAVYLDDLASGTMVFGNLIVDVRRGVYIGGGRDIRVENNVFVRCHPAVTIDDRGLTTAAQLEATVMKDSLTAAKPDQPPYGPAYPGLAELKKYYDSGRGVPPGNNLLLHNISWNGEWVKFLTGDRDPSGYLRVEKNSVGGDPGFLDPDAGDFRLRPDSPAFGLGIEPIPFDRIGLKGKPGVRRP